MISKVDRKMLERESRDLHITHSHHADCLPYPQSDTRRDTTIQTLETIGLVDVPGRVTDRHLLGPVGILLLALRLDADDLYRLVPGGEPTTHSRSHDLLHSAKLIFLALARKTADTLLSQTGQPKSKAPVRHLPDSNSVDALVDSTDALGAVDIHESRKGALGLGAGSSQLVLRDLDRLHAGTEAHSGVSLSRTTRDTPDHASAKLRRTGDTGIVLGFRGDEEQHGSFGRGFDPGPGDETLVDCCG